MAALAGGFVAICSFVGLCAGIRARFAVHRCFAPLMAASVIVVILSLAGMLGALWPACLALYALGLASLAYAWGIKRSRPSGLLLLVAALYAALLVWRFYGCRLRHNDDFSHWGIVARFLLMKDRLPVESDGVLSHQSYPPGSACFIYYLCRLSGFREGNCLIAQNLHYGAALLPLFSFVQKRNRSRLYPIAGLLAATFLFYPSHEADLLVDYVEAFYGVGIAAIILYYRNDPKRALLCALPAMTAVALFKNSGLYFSVISALMLVLVLRRKGVERAWRRGLAGFAPAVAVLLLWTLRVHRSFPSGNMGKHSISIAAFAGQLEEKGASGVLGVAKGMLKAMLHPQGWHMGTVAVLLALLIAIFLIGGKLAPRARRNVRDAVRFGLGAYGLWLILVFGMYVLSMPGSRAQEMPSFTRYNASGYIYATGICCALLLYVLQRGESPLPPALLRIGSAGSALILAGVLALALIPGYQTPIDKFVARRQTGEYVHVCLEDAQERCGLPYGEPCLVFSLCDEDHYFRRYSYTRNNVLYQFGTGDCPFVTAQLDAPESLQIGNQAAERSEVRDYIAKNIQGGGCSAIILLDESPEFEAALEPMLTAGGIDIPICREYERFTYDAKRRPEAAEGPAAQAIKQ